MIQLEERLYTSTEVANILGVSLRSVYRYIEENKLNAEVKTATGRHRFTKKNIVDFLYPADGEKKAEPVERVEREIPVQKRPEVKVVKSEPVKAQKVEEEPEEVEEAPVVEKVEKEKEPEPVIDWLAKFREAAKKFEDEKVVEEPVEVEEPQPEKKSYQKKETYVNPFDSFKEPEEKHEQKFYYRSRLGGLKDIAQNIDKVSQNSSLPYAFTLNSGLSLYKPIKPFSLLHVYIKSVDKDFFERVLLLTPSDETNAQLCLLVTDDMSLYANRDTLHGLQVVAKKKLLDDIRNYDDGELIDEAESILS